MLNSFQHLFATIRKARARLVVKKFSRQVFLLGGLAILSHLVFDDFSYWLYLIGLEKVGSQQVFWFYPFDPNRATMVKNGLDYFATRHLTTLDIAKAYLIKTPKLFFLEIIFTTLAMIILFRTKQKHES